MYCALQHEGWSGAACCVIVPAMSNTGDIDDLAQRYLDLWQDQVRALAADEENARALRQLLRAWGLPDTPGDGSGPVPGGGGSGGAGTPGAFMAMMRAMMPAMTMAAGPGMASPGTGGTSSGEDLDKDSGKDGERQADESTAGAAPPSGTSGGGAVDLERLLDRLASLEARIVALESERRADATDPNSSEWDGIGAEGVGEDGVDGGVGNGVS